jgi:hypothetical protein
MTNIIRSLATLSGLVLLAGCAVVQPQKPTVEVVPVGVPFVARLYTAPGATNVAVQSATSILGPWATIYMTTNQPNRIDVVDHVGTGTVFYRLVYP